MLIVGAIRHPPVLASGSGGLGTLVRMRVLPPASAWQDSILMKGPRPLLLEHSSLVSDIALEGSGLMASQPLLLTWTASPLRRLGVRPP